MAVEDKFLVDHIEDVVHLYFDGYSVKDAIRLIKDSLEKGEE